MALTAWQLNREGIEREAIRLRGLIVERGPDMHGRYGHWWARAHLEPTRVFT